MIREILEEGPAFSDVQRFVWSLGIADWKDPNGPMRLSENLKLDELHNAPTFVNARLLMRMLAEEGGTEVTAADNLNRAFVRRVFERMILPKPVRETTLHVCKVINEQDLWLLHLVRIVAECAALIRRRKKHFQLTPRGRALLAEAEAGALYRALFVAFFRRLDLTYIFPWRRVPTIQDTMAVILWRLDEAARDWIEVRGLAPEILLPAVYQELRAVTTFGYDTEEWILAGYVLEPLVGFGLIERRDPGDWPSVTEKDSIRVTKSWYRFLSFVGRPLIDA